MANTDKGAFVEDHIRIVGSFGKYQKILLLIVILSNLSCYDMIWMIFVGYTPKHFCDFAQNDNFSQTDRKRIAIPKDSNGYYSSCLMYNISDQIYSNVSNIYDEKLILLHNKSEINACEKWQYEIDSVGPSVVTEYNWVCDKSYYFQLTLSCVGFGKLLGGLLGGIITDRFGRKISYSIFLSVRILGTLISVAVPNEYAFIFGQFLNNLGNSIFCYSAPIILIESTEMKYRNVVFMITNMAWIFGSSILPLLAYVCGHWKIMLWLNIAVCLFFYPALLIFKESPRWLYLHKKFDDYQSVMNYIASSNGRSNTIINADHFFEEDTEDEHLSIIHLFKTREMRRRTILMAVAWFTIGIIYYAIYMNVSQLSGNIFINSFLMAIVDIPVNLLMTWLQDRPSFGRRYTNFISFIIALLSSLFVIIFIEITPNAIVVNVLSLVCKACASSTWGSLAVFSNELYPTSFRTTGLLTGNVIANGASALSPYLFGLTMETWVLFPYVIMGGLSLIAAICIFVLPETLYKILPQTVEEIENEKIRKLSIIEEEETL